MPITRVPEFLCRNTRPCPNGLVTVFGWRPKRPNRPRNIDHAELLGPKVVLRHIGKAAKGTQTPRCTDFPSGFFKHFAMKRLYRPFPGVYASTGKL